MLQSIEFSLSQLVLNKYSSLNKHFKQYLLAVETLTGLTDVLHSLGEDSNGEMHQEDVLKVKRQMSNLSLVSSASEQTADFDNVPTSDNYEADSFPQLTLSQKSSLYARSKIADLQGKTANILKARIEGLELMFQGAEMLRKDIFGDTADKLDYSEEALPTKRLSESLKELKTASGNGVVNGMKEDRVQLILYLTDRVNSQKLSEGLKKEKALSEKLLRAVEGINPESHRKEFLILQKTISDLLLAWPHIDPFVIEVFDQLI